VKVVLEGLKKMKEYKSEQVYIIASNVENNE
jgi:hypothetical protein